MNKLRAFIYIYWKSIISSEYYKDVLATSVKFSLKYFVMLSIFAALITTVSSSIVAVPIVKNGIEDIAKSSKELYPQDFVITSKDNVWTINKPEPYSIPFPVTETEEKDTPNNLVVFYHNGTVDDINKLDTLILVNEKNILVKESNGFRAYPLQNIPNGTFDKVTFEKLADQLKNDLAFVPYLFIPVIFLGLLFYFLGIRLIYLLIISLPIMLIGQIVKVKLNFNQAFKIGLHAITVAILLEVLTSLLRIKIPVAMWFTLVVLIKTTIVLVQIRETDRINGNAQIDPVAAADDKNTNE